MCFHDKRFWFFLKMKYSFQNQKLPMLQSGVMWKASHMQPGSRACFRALEALGFSVLKYSFFHFLQTLFLSFLTFTSTPKMDKEVPSSWISEIFLCYYTLCKFAFLTPFWKCNISDENFFQFGTSVNVLHFTFQTGEKKNHCRSENVARNKSCN